MQKTKERTNAIEMLKEDHRKVKKLFEEFEESESAAEKKKIAAEAIRELKVHAQVEEEIFYPAVRKEIEDEENLMNEAEEEHHVAKVLIQELESMPKMDDHYEAKFIVLAENIRHHIKEEEGEMLPQAKKTDLDFEKLGSQMEQRKQELQQGTPDAKVPTETHA